MADTTHGWTTSELLSTVMRRWTGSDATSQGEDDALEEMRYAWQEVVAIGDEVPDVGWDWLLATASHTATETGGVFDNPQSVELPGFHRGLNIRNTNSNGRPTSFEWVSPADAHQITYNRAEGGLPAIVWTEGFNPATNGWRTFFYPTPTVTIVAGVVTDPIYLCLYVLQGVDLVDSPFTADNVLIPAIFREVLVWGALKRLFENSDTTGKRDHATQQHAQAIERLMIHAYASRQRPQRVTVTSERRIAAGQRRFRGRFAGRDWLSG